MKKKSEIKLSEFITPILLGIVGLWFNLAGVVLIAGILILWRISSFLYHLGIFSRSPIMSSGRKLKRINLKRAYVKMDVDEEFIYDKKVYVVTSGNKCEDGCDLYGSKICNTMNCLETPRDGYKMIHYKEVRDENK